MDEPYMGMDEYRVALLAEGVGRNMDRYNRERRRTSVALLAEGVGRNTYTNEKEEIDISVALLAEGVGRNGHVFASHLNSVSLFSGTFAVALLAEGVGRNQHTRPRSHQRLQSPSSRRAWVEILRR